MRVLIAGIVIGLGASASQAQQITIQQPVVGTTSVQTTVSVPDRGSVLLGGVGRAESFRQSYGPFPSGSTRGFSRSASSMRASVYIIDLRAMDEAILASVPDSPVPLMIRGREVVAEPRVPDREEPSPAEKALKFVRLAQQAEAAGKTGVARLHWQMAARHGSTMAQEKLSAPPADSAHATARN